MRQVSGSDRSAEELSNYTFNFITSKKAGN